jgi:Guanine nucleotide exchange factor synembryn
VSDGIVTRLSYFLRPCFSRLVQLYQVLLFNEKQDATFHQIRLNVVNCLINVPGETTSWFAPEPTLQALFGVMHALVYSVPKDENGRRQLDTSEIDGTLTPVLLVLTSISKAIPRARLILRQLVFPAELLDPSTAPMASKEDMKSGKKGIDPPKALAESDSIAKHLVNVMCSFRAGLKHHASDFLFVLCNSDGRFDI